MTARARNSALCDSPNTWRKKKKFDVLPQKLLKNFRGGKKKFAQWMRSDFQCWNRFVNVSEVSIPLTGKGVQLSAENFLKRRFLEGFITIIIILNRESLGRYARFHTGQWVLAKRKNNPSPFIYFRQAWIASFQPVFG